MDGATRTPLPDQIHLEQNYPNPFNPQTYIRFRLLEPTEVTLKIYDALGQEVRTLASQERRESGDWQVLWDGKDDSGILVASGVYVCQLASGASSIAAKMSLVR
jgi:flagellar hook assembly protein FlgD